MTYDDLRRRGAILLISCYELGHQPLGLAWPMGFLAQAGLYPEVLDLAIEPLEEQRVRRASFVGISVPMHTALRMGVRAARRVRVLNPGCHICFYGLYSSLNADYLLGNVADSVIGGEFEEPLVRLILALRSGRELDVEGVGRRGALSAPHLKRLPFAVPRRSSLPPLESYAHLVSGDVESPAGYVEASRGCKHLCLHCPIPPVYKGRFFVVPAEVVLQDIRQLVLSGARHITFGDPDFLNGPGHALRIARAMHHEFPHLTFDFTAKVEHVLNHRDLLHDFAKHGCLFVVSAVESLSDTVLTDLSKGHTRADVATMLGLLREAGLELRPSLVSFTPWTSLEDYLEVLDFIESENLIDNVDPIQYAIRLLVPPGSLLLRSAAMQPYLGELVPDTFSYSWKHPDPRMDLLHIEVTRLVEHSVARQEDPYLTFLRIRALAQAKQDDRVPAEVFSAPARQRKRAPRLTEPWFC